MTSKSPKRERHFQTQVRNIVKKVIDVCCDEKLNNRVAVPLAQVFDRVANYTGISKRTIQRIKREAIEADCMPLKSASEKLCPTRRREWLEAVGRHDLIGKLDEGKARRNYKICERHFAADCIKFSKFRTVKYLTENAYPTLNLPTIDNCSSSSQCEGKTAINNQYPENMLAVDTGVNVSILSNQTTCSGQDEFTNCGTKMFRYDSRCPQSVLHLSANTPRKRKSTSELREAKKAKDFDLESIAREDFLKLCDKFLSKHLSQLIKLQIGQKMECSGNRDPNWIDIQYNDLKRTNLTINTNMPPKRMKVADMEATSSKNPGTKATNTNISETPGPSRIAETDSEFEKDSNAEPYIKVEMDLLTSSHDSMTFDPLKIERVSPKLEIFEPDYPSLNTSLEPPDSSSTDSPDEMLVDDNFEEEKSQTAQTNTPPEMTKKIIYSIKEILDKLTEKRYINETENFLLDMVSLDPSELTPRTHNRAIFEFTDDLQTFAILLYFFSAEGYTYIRQEYNTRLPPAITVMEWWKRPGGNPGFTKETLDAICMKVLRSEKKIFCALVLNETFLRGNVQYVDNEGYYGHVDIGSGLDCDCSDAATELLVLTAVSLNASWRVPIGYFMTKAIKTEQKAHLIQTAISILEQTGVDVVSVSFNGSPSNIKMCEALGCTFQVSNMKTTFRSHSRKEMCVFPDPTDMFIRINETLEAFDFQDADKRTVTLKHVKLLPVYLNSKEKHAKVANRALSRSVASSLTFCKERLKSTASANLDGTILFINRINDVYDILTSRKGGVGLKGPATNYSKTEILEILDWATNYLENIFIIIGKQSKKLVESPYQLGVIGLCAAARTAKVLIRRFLDTRYWDNLQFSKFGINYDLLHSLNPTLRQKEASARSIITAYKKILKHTKTLREEGNCVPIENISILESKCAVDKINMTTNLPNSNKDEAVTDDLDHILTFRDSEYNNYVVYFVAGFVVQYLTSRVKCDNCLSALVCINKRAKNIHVTIKNVTELMIKSTIEEKEGNLRMFSEKLMNPSNDVVSICKASEVVVRRAIAENGSGRIDPKINDHLVSKTMGTLVGKNFFREIDNHQYDNDPLANHVVELAKAVVQVYIDTRLKHWAKKFRYRNLWIALFK